MATILFLTTNSMNDATSAIGRGFADNFRHLGHRLEEISFATPEGTTKFNAALQRDDIYFAFSFIGFASDLAAQDTSGQPVNLWEATGIPFLTLQGDSPAYYFDRHVVPAESCASFYTFPEHLELRKSLPKARGILAGIPMGHAEGVAKDALDFRQKERGRLLFLKNGNDPKRLVQRWQEVLPSSINVMLLDLASQLTRDLDHANADDIDLAVRGLLVQRGIDLCGSSALRLLLVAQLDDYLRRVKSTMIAEVLADYPVDMYGENWGHLDFRGKRINFTPTGDYVRSSRLIRESLGMIDMSPNTERAAHERPLRAFGAFTLCVTNRQRFFFENVANARDFSYEFHADSFRQKIEDVLAAPSRYVEIGIAAAEDFRSRFSPARFPELMIEVAEVLRATRFGLRGPIEPYFVWPPKNLASPPL